ncbi:MAG: transposase [Acidobacteriota bacterium]
MVKEHLSPNHIIAAGMKALPGGGTSFASTQAAWRFYANPRTNLQVLGEPMLKSGKHLLAQECSDWGLVAHDWSQLRLGHQTSRKDLIPIGSDQGYSLETALLLSDRDGASLTPLVQHLWSKDGCLTTCQKESIPELELRDALTLTMNFLAQQKWDRRLCHIIDRGADSARHLRCWDDEGHSYLVRATEDHYLTWQARAMSTARIADLLPLFPAQAVEWEGGITAQLMVGETEVLLTRPSRRLGADGKEKVEKGRALPLRLIVCEVRLPDETIAARWCLLSSVEAKVAASTLVDWYYWRWRIESYFKLLKSAGFQLEHWQQETALAMAKRLCVVALACVVVWQLQRAEGPVAEQTRAVLLRLSGRQVRRGHAPAPALLAGLWSLLSVLDALDHFTLDELKRIANSIQFTTASG